MPHPRLVGGSNDQLHAMTSDNGDGKDVETSTGPPPKSLLLYLVRMGSFTSTPKVANDDNQDEDFEIEGNVTRESLIRRCQTSLAHWPPLLPRQLTYVDSSSTEPSGPTVRIMQWNVLSQALGLQNDNFVACPVEALDWRDRRFRLLEEILTYEADVLCLQEVDHFNFLCKALEPLGYKGIFFPKPDSPCLYIRGNNGADGCAIFYNCHKLEAIKIETRILEVWRVQSNQVAILAVLRFRSSGQCICVLTTHLKARQGTLLSTLRNEEGKDLTDFVHSTSCSQLPLLICGDFNAEPSEPVYNTMTDTKGGGLGLSSAYATVQSGGYSEPPYTTWKIREDGEVSHTIDYIFYSSSHWEPHSALQFPSEEAIGAGRVPSMQYPSDHFSLVCDFVLKSDGTLGQSG